MPQFGYLGTPKIMNSHDQLILDKLTDNFTPKFSG